MARPGYSLGLALLLVLLLALPAAAGWDPREQAELERQARETIRRSKQADPTLDVFFRQAEGWAVYPTVGKGGFWVGIAYGKGVLYQNGRVVGFTELKQLTVGLQFGGQAYSEIIFLKDAEAVTRFKSEKIEFDAQVSAVVVNTGTAASVDYHDGVAVFTYPKGGLMAEASVGGQKFSYRAKDD